MRSKSDNIEIMINAEADEVMNKSFKLIQNGYQNSLELMRGGEFLLNYVHSLYYKRHKINPNRSRPCIESSSDWITNKKATKTSINKKDNKCFKYVVTIALNHEK